jgi:hypothetical protein
MYDLEKYREKREKVLGVKSRGLSFSMIASIVAFLIILGTGFIAVPEVISYVSTKNMDDAIYKLADSAKWPDETVDSLLIKEGVKQAEITNHGLRLVLTFNRNTFNLDTFESNMKENGLTPVLLNRMDHKRRLEVLKEEEEFEAI